MNVSIDLGVGSTLLSPSKLHNHIERRHAAYTAQSLPLQCSLLRLSLSADLVRLRIEQHILTKRNILDRDSDDTARIVVIVVVLFNDEKKSSFALLSGVGTGLKLGCFANLYVCIALHTAPGPRALL